MSDLIGDAMVILNEKMRSFATQTLIIRMVDSQGEALGERSIPMVIEGEQRPVLTILGTSPSAIDLGEQAPDNQVYAFSFWASDLVQAGEAIPPAEGMVILWPVGDVTYQCTVMAPGDGLKAWESRSRHTRWLVQTRITGKE